MDPTVTCLDLIRRIYEATAGAAPWEDVAEGLSDALAGAHVALSLQPLDIPSARLGCMSGFSPSEAAQRVHAFLDRVSHPFEACQPFVRGFARGPEDLGIPTLGHLIGMENGRSIGSVIAFRAPGEPEFTQAEQGLANRLVPHLARALAILRRLLTTAQHRIALAEVVDRLPTGIILLTENGEVVFASRSAMRILQRDDGLSIVDGELRAEGKLADRTLQQYIAAAVAHAPAADHATGGGLLVPRIASADAYSVAVSRLLPGRSIRDAVASVIVGDPGAATAPAVEMLQSLHGLTAAEADLVNHLVGGRSLEEAAKARGVSVNTARSQIKQVFHKTGTHRQGELVQLVLRCLMPMADE